MNGLVRSAEPQRPEDAATTLVRMMRPGTLQLASLPPLALYVHLPWCLRKCPYCDFNSHATPGEGLPERRYLEALVADHFISAAVAVDDFQSLRLRLNLCFADPLGQRDEFLRGHEAITASMASPTVMPPRSPKKARRNKNTQRPSPPAEIHAQSRPRSKGSQIFGIKFDPQKNRASSWRHRGPDA